MDKKSVFAAIGSALFGIVSGIAINWISYFVTTPKESLEFRSEKAIPFESGNERIAIYYSTVRNSGSTPVENVFIQQSVPGAKIEKGRVEAPAGVAHSDQIEPSGLSTNISNLNPDEVVSASVFVKSKSELPDKPILKVRARGATTSEVDDGGRASDGKALTLAMVLSPIAAVVAFLLLRMPSRPQIAPDPAGIMFVTLDFNRGIDWPSLLSKTKRLDIFVVFGRTWREGNLPHLQRLAGGEISVRLVVPDFENKELMSDLASRFGMDVEKVVLEIRDTVSRFQEIFQGRSGAQLQVWLHKRVPTYTYYRFDEVCVVSGYRHRLGKGEVPTLQLRPDGSLTKFYDAEFLDFVSENSKYARRS